MRTLGIWDAAAANVATRKETISCIKQKARNTISREFHTLTSRTYFRHVLHFEIQNRIRMHRPAAFCSARARTRCTRAILVLFLASISLVLQKRNLRFGSVISRAPRFNALLCNAIKCFLVNFHFWRSRLNSLQAEWKEEAKWKRERSTFHS